PQIPPQLERIVSRCLEKQPARRFQTASDLGFALEALLTPSGSRLKEETASSAAESVVAAPRRIGREQWWIAVATLAVLLAAGFAWAYFTRPLASEGHQMKFSLALPEKMQIKHLALSPNGKWLAVTLAKGGSQSLWALDLATGETKQLVGEP